MSTEISQLSNPEELTLWDQYVADHSQGTFAQTSSWGKVKQQFGWTPRILAVQDGPTIIGGVQYLTRAIPLGQTMVYAPYGPLWTEGQTKVLSLILAELKRQTSNSLAVKLEPHVDRDASYFVELKQESDTKDQVEQVLGSAGFQLGGHMQQPEETIILDLSRTEEELLADMRQTTRRYVRQAERAGLAVEHQAGPDSVEKFYEILQQVDARKQFGIHTLPYYQAVATAFGDQAHLLFVKQGEEVLGAYFLVQVGNKAWELYGGAKDSGQPLRANYLLKWKSILAMKEAGVTVYDQGGIAPSQGIRNQELGTSGKDSEESGISNLESGSEPTADSKHPLAGVTYFKQGFGGARVAWIGSWDWSAKPYLYKLARLSGKL